MTVAHMVARHQSGEAFTQFWAARQGQLKAVNYLIEHAPAMLHEININKATPLSAAIQSLNRLGMQRMAPVINRLLAEGLTPTETDNDTLSRLGYAIDQTNTPVVLKRSKKQQSSALQAFSHPNALDKPSKMIPSPVSPKPIGVDSLTLLPVTTMQGDLAEVFRVAEQGTLTATQLEGLRDKGIDLYTRDNEGQTIIEVVIRGAIGRYLHQPPKEANNALTLEAFSPVLASLVKAGHPLLVSESTYTRIQEQLTALGLSKISVKHCMAALVSPSQEMTLCHALEKNNDANSLRFHYSITHKKDLPAFNQQLSDQLSLGKFKHAKHLSFIGLTYRDTGLWETAKPLSRTKLASVFQAMIEHPLDEVTTLELSEMPELFGVKMNPASLALNNEISRTVFMDELGKVLDASPQLQTLTLVDIGLEDQHVEALITRLDRQENPVVWVNISKNPNVSPKMQSKLHAALARYRLRAELQGQTTDLVSIPVLNDMPDDDAFVKKSVASPSINHLTEKQNNRLSIKAHHKKKKFSLPNNQSITRVNPSYHYRGDVIVLLWEKALRDQHCQFFIAKENIQQTLFGHNAQNATSQQHAAGLVINADGSLYRCPLNNRTLSIAQAIDRESVSNTVESTMLALDAAITQCRAWQALALTDDDHYDLLTQHTIVMPYHNGPNHWNFACLATDWEKDNITKAVLTVYEPLHATLQLNSLKKRLANSLGIDEQYIDVIPRCTLQQKDGASCGAISGENGVHYITGNKERWDKQRKTVYQKGARTLREKHLTTIDNKHFTQEQQANRFYRDPVKKFQLQPYANDILVTLEKYLTEHKNFRPMFTAYVRLFLSLHQRHTNALPNDQYSSIIQHTLSTWFRENRQVLKTYTLPEETQLNLFNIFFNDDDDALPWKDDILDDSIDILNPWHNAHGKQLDVQAIIDEVLKAAEEATKKAENTSSLATNQHKHPLTSVASDNSDDKAISHSPINANDSSAMPMSPEAESKATPAPIKIDDHLSQVSVFDASQSWNTLSLCDQIQQKYQWHYPSTDQSTSFVTDDQVATANDAISQAIADYEWLYHTVKAVATAFNPLPSTEALYQDKDMSDLSLCERLFCIGKALTQRFEDDQAGGHENESMPLIPPGDPRLTEDTIIEQLLRLQQRCLKLSSVACFAYADAKVKPPLFQLQTLINGLPKHHRIQMDWQCPEKDPLHVPGLTAAQVIFYKRFAQTLSNMYAVSKVYATKLIKLDSALTKWEKNAQISKNLVLGAAGFFGGFGHLLHAGTEIIKIKEMKTLESYIVEAVEMGIQSSVIAGGAAEMIKEGGEVALEIYEHFEGSSDDESEADESHDARQFRVTSTPTGWRRTSKRLKALNDTFMSVSDFDQKHVQLGLQLAYRYQEQLSRLKPSQVTRFSQSCAEHLLEALEMGFLKQTYGQTTNDQFIQYGLQWHAYVTMEKSRAVNVTLKTGQRVSADDLLKKPALKGYYKSNDEVNELSEPMTYQWKKGKIQCNPYLKDRIVVKQGNGSDVFGTRLASKHEIAVAKKDKTGAQITCWPNVMSIKAKRKPSTIKAEEAKFQQMQHEDCPYTEVWALKWRVQLLEKELVIVKKAQKGDYQDILQKLNHDKQELQQKIDTLTKQIEENKKAHDLELQALKNEIIGIKVSHDKEIKKLNQSLKEKDGRIENLEDSLKEQNAKIKDIMARLNMDNHSTADDVANPNQEEETLINQDKGKDVVQLKIDVDDNAEAQVKIAVLGGDLSLFNKTNASINSSVEHTIPLVHKK